MPRIPLTGACLDLENGQTRIKIPPLPLPEVHFDRNAMRPPLRLWFNGRSLHTSRARVARKTRGEWRVTLARVILRSTNLPHKRHKRMHESYRWCFHVIARGDDAAVAFSILRAVTVHLDRIHDGRRRGITIILNWRSRNFARAIFDGVLKKLIVSVYGINCKNKMEERNLQRKMRGSASRSVKFFSPSLGIYSCSAMHVWIFV